ncbi:LOW QUALITY PROTEIN: hypothetical protein PanWU01x14_279750 [Parasponia andersonii]|uniref:Uncharacterized protein n=1 Tax=Parasponia andersonii TaxID=3476 RepID=A0A2P5B1U6_PARAD|nr:LOW QUALITY PROTEIN: hypothetical protein PanWU01x14_279750 [Parasponia andersonii]
MTLQKPLLLPPPPPLRLLHLDPTNAHFSVIFIPIIAIFVFELTQIDQVPIQFRSLQLDQLSYQVFFEHGVDGFLAPKVTNFEDAIEGEHPDCEVLAREEAHDLRDLTVGFDLVDQRGLDRADQGAEDPDRAGGRHCHQSFDGGAHQDLPDEHVLVEPDQASDGHGRVLPDPPRRAGVAENRLQRREELRFQDQVLQLAVEPDRDSVLELSQEPGQLVLVLVLEGVPQGAGEGADALAVDPGLDFGPDRGGDPGEGVSRDSASEEGGEPVAGSGALESLDEGFEAGEELGEGREIRVLGENGVGLRLEL